MSRIKIMLVVGARPNFMKAAPLLAELKKRLERFKAMLVHTGQHYDRNLSKLFFEDLHLPEPDIYLGIGSDSHARQTAKIMIAVESALQDHKPDLVIVFGDVNSTFAAALVAAKMQIKIAHVEAGLRSFDMSMPEEINRILTDRLSEIHFITEASALKNLLREGIGQSNIFMVGNIMIDSLINNLEIAKGSNILSNLQIKAGEYAVATVHRPSNVDDREVLLGVLDAFQKISLKIPVIFPCHPRTKRQIRSLGNELQGNLKSFKIIDPLGYIDFLKLQSQAKFVLTDSGGIQEETTYLGIPCITLRENTERPITVEVGSNVICGTSPPAIVEQANKIMAEGVKPSGIPALWDGKTAARIADILTNKYFSC